MRGPRLLLAALSAACVLPAGASAARLAIAETVSEGYWSGADRVVVEVQARPGTRCRLEVRGGRAPAHLAGLRIGARARAFWRWRAHAAGPGPSTFTARCEAGQLWAWQTRLVELGIPSRSGALAGRAPAGGALCDAQGVCLPGGPFEVGQCTWYAAGRRPDLLGVVHGNAAGWLEAAAGRVAEGARPLVGALAVWRAGRGAAGPLGHVGYVAAVARGRVLIDDSNWLPTPTSAPLQVHEHWVANASPSGYIYGGPAGTGPAS